MQVDGCLRGRRRWLGGSVCLCYATYSERKSREDGAMGFVFEVVDSGLRLQALLVFENDPEMVAWIQLIILATEGEAHRFLTGLHNEHK